MTESMAVWGWGSRGRTLVPGSGRGSDIFFIFKNLSNNPVLSLYNILIKIQHSPRHLSNRTRAFDAGFPIFTIYLDDLSCLVWSLF